MKKISLIFSLLLLACLFISSCDNNDVKDDIVYDFGGMKYGIAVSKEEASAYDNRVLIDNEINPFSEEYYYSDKVQRQAYVKKIENKYNIKFDFTVKASDEDCYAVAWNSYPLIERNYSHNVVKNYAHPLYDLNTNVLQGEKSYDTKTDEYISPYILSVLKLVPYWTVESSPKFENIKGYLGNDDIIDTFSKIFDKCYFDKMGVCYTEVTKFPNITYLTKVELTDKGADYAIDYFKQVEKDKDESEFSSFLVKILIGLVVAIIIVYLLRGIILSITKQ